MDCCSYGYDPAPRHWMWNSPLTSVGAMLTGDVGPRGSTATVQASETASAALDVLRRSISVDVHTHGGKTGITSKAPPRDDLANAMRSGSLAVACLADVPDGPVLGRNAEGVLAAVRAPEPGQLYRHHLERLAWMDEMVANHGLRRALSTADLEAAHKAGQPAIIGDVEGLDFLETKLERLEEAHQRGIRHVQLVHYAPNDIGDFQTGAIMHQGLTSFGAEVIRACHRLGFVCDVAHATEDMVKQVVRIATKPILLSHTALFGSRAMGQTPLTGRQISPDHARAIAETSGSIGIWHFFPSLDKYVDGLKEMAEIRRRSRQHRHRPARFTGEHAGLHAMGPPRRDDAARRLHPRGGREDRRRQLYARLSRCGRLIPLARDRRRIIGVDQTQAQPDLVAVIAAFAVRDRFMAALSLEERDPNAIGR
jgi:membrane dipeptidase